MGPWRRTGAQGRGAWARRPSSTSNVDPLWAAFNTDYFKSQTIYRVDVAATGPSSPIPPGISHLPGPGQFYASPALERLLRSTPATELGARFPGKQIGSIGPSALPSPSSLIIVIGHTAAELSKVPGASQVTAFNTTTGHSGGSLGWDSNRLQIILAVGALALLFPVLMFIATATRLSAARREQRFAAMRLVGATPRQVSLIAAVEASVAALVGVAVGFGLFFAFRPLVTNVPFTGQAFAPGDLSLSPTDILLVAVGVPIAAALAARVALRRVVISPLGVSRRVTPPPPRAYRLVPLVAGIAELSYFVEVGRPKSTGGQIDAYFGGCLLIMVGLIVAGPWLTMVGSRVMARRTSRTSVLIAGRRMSDNPRGAFRAISGLILALFVGSVSVGIIGTILDDQGTTGGGTVARETLVAQFGPLENEGPLPVGQPTTASVPRQLVTELGSIRDIRGVTLVHAGDAQADGSVPILVSCAQLADTPNVGRCAPGAAVATITGNLDNAASSSSTLATKVWPAAAISAERLEALPVRAMIVQSSGSTAAIEAARTAIEVAMPNAQTPATLGEINATSNAQRYRAPTTDQDRDSREPGHRRLQPCGQRDHRRERAQTALQPLATHRRSRPRLAPRGRVGNGSPVAPRRGDLGRNGVPGRRPLPQVTTRRISPTAGSRLLRHRRRRSRRVPRDHRRDPSADRAHHRTRDRAQRIAKPSRMSHPAHIRHDAGSLRVATANSTCGGVMPRGRNDGVVTIAGERSTPTNVHRPARRGVRRLTAVLAAALLLGTTGPLIARSAPTTPGLTAGDSVDLRVLLIGGVGGAASDPTTAAWVSGLSSQGVAYTEVDGIGTPGAETVTLPTLESSATHGLYNGVVFAGKPGDFAAGQFTTLFAYESAFGIRQLDGDFVPAVSGTLGLIAPTVADPSTGSGISTTVPVPALTPAGLATFGALAGPVPMDTTTFGAPDAVLSPLPTGATETPLLTDAAGNVLIGVYQHPTVVQAPTDPQAGVTELTVGFNYNQYMTQWLLLGPGLIDWVTGAAHVGLYRNYSTVHIDDMFTADDTWDTTTHANNYDPAAALKMRPVDVDNEATWSRDEQLPARQPVQRRKHVDEQRDHPGPRSAARRVPEERPGHG